MKKLTEDEVKELTESKGFEYVGVKYENNKTYINFICTSHKEKGIQKKLLNDMRKSTGKCNYCLGKKRTHDDFKEIINQLHPTIDLLSEYVQATKPIKCRCEICGYEWDTIPNRLLNGSGCRKCGNVSQSKKKAKLHENFITEINEKFNGKITILSKYQGAKKRIKCKCNIDQTVWETTPTSLLSHKVGCPTCIGKGTSERCKKTNEQFLEELKHINCNIIPLEEYIDDHTKIKCMCLIHNYKWKVTPNKILHRKTGCPKCSKSSYENQICKILDNWNYNYVFQKRFSDCKDKYPLPFDFYLKDFNICIEYDGEQHYYPIQRGKISYQQACYDLNVIQLHDKIKNKYCKENNIKLIRIPYWENDNIELYLWDNLVKHKAIIETKIS